MHLAGISNSGLGALRVAGLHAPPFKLVAVPPGFPPTDEDRKNFSELNHMQITMFVGDDKSSLA